MITKNFFLLIRIVIGMVYLISGGQKLVEPVENFIYVIESYKIIDNEVLVQWIGWSFPWLEYILGGFLIIGLWLRLAVIGILLLNISFIFVVSQALIRDLPLRECGCFGDLMGSPLYVTLGLDILTVIGLIMLFMNFNYLRNMSLDYLLKK